jgi:hypothetical protein
MPTTASLPDKTPTRIGELLLAADFVLNHELEGALKLSKQLNQPVCQVLQSQQRLSSCEKRSLLSLQKKLRSTVQQAKLPQLSELGCRLGDLLVACGEITEAQLERALLEQAEHSRPLGSILLKKGLISLPQLKDCLQLQQKLMSAAAAALLTLASYADDPVVNDPPGEGCSLISRRKRLTRFEILSGSRVSPEITLAPYSAADEIMRSKNGKMVLRLTNVGIKFRTFF